MIRLIAKNFVPLLLMLLCFGLALGTLMLDEKIYQAGESLAAQREVLAVIERENQALRLEVAEEYSCESLELRVH